MPIDLKTLTIKKAHKHLTDGDFSAVDLATAYLENIKLKNKELNAYLEIFDDALEQATEADNRIKAGKATVLTGVPFAIKDNILIKGRRAGSASKILEGYTASYDATVIEKLKKAGAIFLGRTNMDEFAMGASTETSGYGVTRNPHDLSRVPGGSSGGSAVAVASEMALVALGSDTGGSVRQPASFCGVVGLKPTYGALSRYGLMAMASSLDHIGCITKTVSDAEIIFDFLKGRDPFDSTSIKFETVNYKLQTKNLKIGIPTAFTESKGIEPAVLSDFKKSVAKLKRLGHTIKEISLPNVGYSIAVYYIIVPAEASTNLARFDGVKYGLHKDGKNLTEDYFLTRGEGFGKEVRRRILLGAHVLSSNGYYDAYYNKANLAREVIRADFEKAFKEVDIIATPTAPTTAFKIGEKANDSLQMYLADIFTAPANLAGIPAISLPSGFCFVAGKKLPLSLQLMANTGEEKSLFELGKEFCEK